jgi:hypothetical protein
MDYIERLAEANDWTPEGLTNYIQSGGPDHAETLSKLIGGTTLPRFSGPRVGGLDIEVEWWGIQSTAWLWSQRICPACMEMQGWIRLYWRFRPFTACPEHGCVLMMLCPECKKFISYRSALLVRCSCGVRFSGVASRAEPGELRIARVIAEGLSQPSEMQLGEISVSLSTAQWVKLFQCLGSLVPLNYPKERMTLVETIEFNIDRVRLLGVVNLMDRWPDAFMRYLGGLAADAPSGASLDQMFKPAYAVVNQQLSDQEFQFVRDAFYAALKIHYRGSLSKRHRSLMPELVTGHRFQALAKVSRQTGVSRVGLKRMVECAAVPGYRSRPTPVVGREVITMDPADVTALVASASDYKCLKSAAALLGLKRSRLRQLVALGVLTAESHPEWDRTSHWFFAGKTLQNLVERLRSRSQQVPPANGIEFKSILRFWRLAPLELKALMDALLAGPVALHLPEEAGMSAMLVDREQARAWLKAYRAEAVSWLTPTQAARVLGLKEQVVYELIERDLLGSKRTRSGRGWLNRIDPGELQAFRETYVSLATLAKAAGKAPRALLKIIQVVPVTGPTIDGTRQYFFRRTDVHRAGLEDLEKVSAGSLSEVVV